jgi:cytochrome P450
VQSIVRDCLDGMERSGRGADLVPALAVPVPTRAICGLLGVPYRDQEVFTRNTRTMIDTGSGPEQVRAAMGAIVGYLDQLVAERQRRPGPGLLSRLATTELRNGSLSRPELVTVAMILLVGGFETTATMIGLGVYALLEHRSQLDRVLAGPSLWPAAVEELLRHQTIVQNPIQRVALADVPVGGEVIRKGEGVLLVLEAANRDPRAFDDPDRLDVARGARNHLAFSFGPHLCLGHAMARMELEVVLRLLFERFPTLRLAVPAGEVPLRPSTVGLFGVESLPVTW